VWPPVDGGGAAHVGVWCGAERLPPLDEPAALEPGGPEGSLRRGAIGDGAGEACVRFVAGDADEPPDARFVPPPAVGAPDAPFRLDTRPLAHDVDAPPVGAVACEPGEIAFGPGCARVFDDRLLGRGPAAPVLWSVSGSGLDVVLATAPGDPFVLAPLPPETAVRLAVATADAAGRATWTVARATTGAPAPHVVLNEIMANPLGPEPSQEWIEIVNDGMVAAELAGYVLVDLGGETALPEGLLPPGGYALVVNEAFVEDDGIDPPPLPGTLLLRVPELGNDGLTNAGEPIRLRDADGAEVSRFPAVPKPSKAGLTVIRTAPKAPDGLASSFRVADVPTPGASNAGGVAEP
jgi:hypothetical protein